MKSKKNESVDLRKKRPSLLLMGTCTALAVSLVAFEYKSFDEVVHEQVEFEGDFLEDEIIPIHIHSTPPPPPPPPPKQQVLAVVDDDPDIVEELEMLDMEIDEGDEVEVIDLDDEVVAEPEAPFVIVEKMPEFPGGEAALFQFLSENTDYPSTAKEIGIQGIVYVTFVVEKNGAIEDVKVLRGIGGGCDEEAVRVVSSMPHWKPGEQRGEAVRVQYNIPYRFILN